MSAHALGGGGGGGRVTKADHQHLLQKCFCTQDDALGAPALAVSACMIARTQSPPPSRSSVAWHRLDACPSAEPLLCLYLQFVVCVCVSPFVLLEPQCSLGLHSKHPQLVCTASCMPMPTQLGGQQHDEPRLGVCVCLG